MHRARASRLPLLAARTGRRVTSTTASGRCATSGAPGRALADARPRSACSAACCGRPTGARSSAPGAATRLVRCPRGRADQRGARRAVARDGDRHGSRSAGSDNVEYILALEDQPMERGGDSAYARTALGFPDASLDFALVDGHYRDYSAKFILPKIKPGGMLIIDNVNWYLPCRVEGAEFADRRARSRHRGLDRGLAELRAWRDDLDQLRRVGHGHIPAAIMLRLLNVFIYTRSVIMTGDLSALRDRLYESYATQHSGPGSAVRNRAQLPARHPSAAPAARGRAGGRHRLRLRPARPLPVGPTGTTRPASTSARSRSRWPARPASARSGRATTAACCASGRASSPRSPRPICSST